MKSYLFLVQAQVLPTRRQIAILVKAPDQNDAATTARAHLNDGDGVDVLSTQMVGKYADDCNRVQLYPGTFLE